MLKKILAFFKGKKKKSTQCNFVDVAELQNYRKPKLTSIQAKKLFNMLHATMVSATVNDSDELAKFLFAKCRANNGYNKQEVVSVANELMAEIYWSDGSFHCYHKGLIATYLKFRGIPK